MLIPRHIKEHIKEEYIDTAKMDDNDLLMQYFKKHDTDNNMKLDGLELLKAISNMEGKIEYIVLFGYKFCNLKEDIWT